MSEHGQLVRMWECGEYSSAEEAIFLSAANEIRTLQARAQSAEAERDRLRGALEEIKALKSEPIGDTGFAQGPLVLLRVAQRITKAALSHPLGEEKG